MKNEEFIERRIITGMIISTEYLQRIQPFWDATLLESTEFRKVATWCMEYFNKYKRAPDADIESIFVDHIKTLPKADVAYIEDVLSDLSDEYGRGTQFNAAYLYDKTVEYFKGRQIDRHNEEVQGLIEMGKVTEAELLAQSYQPTIVETMSVGLDLSGRDALQRIEEAFSDTAQRVLSYPGTLGAMWNEHLVRGGFVAFLGPEKRGKTFMLIELAMRAFRQKANVAFFEAGDMTESQMLKRICIYQARRSDRERYCGEHFRPVGDCIFNQLNLCTREDRNCDHGIFDVSLEDFNRNRNKYVTAEVLAECFEQYPDYEPCDSATCPQRSGTAWIRKVSAVQPLDAGTAKKELRKFVRRYKRHFKLATYASNMLTVEEIERCINHWERYDNFVPDVILIDYADLLDAGPDVKEFRHRQNAVWQKLRGLSQKRHALVITATQADADSYVRGRLGLSNFSEDKRKYGHVTAMYGLNQDPQGREKKLGILRINEIVVREGEFSNDHEVHVLQDLYQGRPFLESF